ncbi:MAG: hypothetical protein IPL02_05800 [Moraxellaceae bacterium]|nr:hypothetical protein [Moraxellaceae bacterium]
MTITLTAPHGNNTFTHGSKANSAKRRLLQKHNLKLITFYKWASKLSAKQHPPHLSHTPSAQATPPYLP